MEKLKPCPLCGGESGEFEETVYGCQSCGFYLDDPALWNRLPRVASEVQTVIEEMKDEYRAQKDAGSEVSGTTLGTLRDWISRLALISEMETTRKCNHGAPVVCVECAKDVLERLVKR